MQDLSLVVLPDLKDNGIQPVSHPADREKLLWRVGSSIEPIRPGEQLLRLLEPYASAGISPQALTFSRVEAEAHVM